MKLKVHDRVYVTKGVHAGKYGVIISIARNEATITFDENFQGGTYYVSLTVLEAE